MRGKEKLGMTVHLFSHPPALYAEGSQVPGENGHTAAAGVMVRMSCDEGQLHWNGWFLFFNDNGWLHSDEL